MNPFNRILKWSFGIFFGLITVFIMGNLMVLNRIEGPARYGNHEELRQACLKMIENYSCYTNCINSGFPLSSGEKGVYVTGLDPLIPDAIKSLNFRYAFVNTNYVMLWFSIPSRSTIIVDGGGAEEMITNRYKGYLLSITNGIWLK